MAGADVAVTDRELALLVLEYAKELGRAATTDTVTLPVARNGHAEEASLLLGPASQIAVLDNDDATLEHVDLPRSMLRSTISADDWTCWSGVTVTCRRLAATMDRRSSPISTASNTEQFVAGSRGGSLRELVCPGCGLGRWQQLFARDDQATRAAGVQQVFDPVAVDVMVVVRRKFPEDRNTGADPDPAPPGSGTIGGHPRHQERFPRRSFCPITISRWASMRSSKTKSRPS